MFDLDLGTRETQSSARGSRDTMTKVNVSPSWSFAASTCQWAAGAEILSIWHFIQFLSISPAQDSRLEGHLHNVYFLESGFWTLTGKLRIWPAGWVCKWTESHRTHLHAFVSWRCTKFWIPPFRDPPFGNVSIVHHREIKGETWRALIGIENAQCIAPTPCLATWRESCGTRSLPSSIRSWCAGQTGRVHVHHESQIIDINRTTKIQLQKLWVPIISYYAFANICCDYLWGHEFLVCFSLCAPSDYRCEVSCNGVLTYDSHRTDTTLHQLGSLSSPICKSCCVRGC